MEINFCQFGFIWNSTYLLVAYLSWNPWKSPETHFRQVKVIESFREISVVLQEACKSCPTAKYAKHSKRDFRLILQKTSLWELDHNSVFKGTGKSKIVRENIFESCYKISLRTLNRICLFL